MHALVASPFKSAYNAAKHGVAGFTKTLALEVRAADGGVQSFRTAVSQVLASFPADASPRHCPGAGVDAATDSLSTLLLPRPRRCHPLCQVATKGVTVNAVCPGYVLTDLIERQLENQAKTRGISKEKIINDVLLADQVRGRGRGLIECAGRCTSPVWLPGGRASREPLETGIGLQCMQEQYTVP